MIVHGALAVAGIVALGGCGFLSSAPRSPAESAGTAGAACLGAVNTNFGARSATIISSLSSPTDTSVLVRSEDGTVWRCLATPGGVVRELSVT